MKRSTSPKKKGKRCHPRVGKKYQADIPTSIITEESDDHSQLVRVGPDYSTAGDRSDSFSLGLSSVPLVWENEGRKKIGTENKSLSPLPGCRSEAWTEIEKESFVLGLYLFGKNLALVMRLVGTKKMGDIQCFYYGKFYNSSEYRNWSECLKSTSERRVFSCWRHEKLLSRLFPLVPNVLQDMLIESSVNFTNKTLSFEDYVFALKDIVGVDALVKAFGIGQGKKDLTGTPRKPRKRTTSVSSADSGAEHNNNAYYSLTPSEIVEILRGHSEPSDSEARGLFWRAVWPRLKAKGWRSEQLRDFKALGLKHSTVFIVDGAKKFSRRLAKGVEYFDSVNSVLTRVASQPRLLGHRERRAAKAADQQALGFTVVDTSLVVDEAEPARLVELRNLPAQPASTITSPDLSSVGTNGQDETTALKMSGDSAREESSGMCEASPPPRKFLFDLNVRYVPSDPEEDDLVPVRGGAKLMIDLNVAYVPSDSEDDITGTDVIAEESTVQDSAAAIDGSRNSLRRRPMTKRALEALENDFFSSKKKKK